jgi:FkbM family methyltransferase
MSLTRNLSVSIITPSFNQARFLSECLASVRAQDVAMLEHLVFDPGSTDGSIEIASKAPGITLINEPDEGQADAVGKGMLAANGDVLGWLNSDDAYYDSTVVSSVLDRFSESDAPDIVYGRGCYVDEHGSFIKKAYINTRPDTLGETLKQQVGILQPAVFLRRTVVEQIGVLSRNLHFCMDYEYWIRAVQAGLRIVFLDRDLARARYYPSNKTMGQRGQSLAEVCACLKKKFGFVHSFWIKTLAEFNVEGFDGILASSHSDIIKHPDKVRQEEARLAWAYNGDFDTLYLLKKSESGTPERATLEFMQERGLVLTKPVSLLSPDQAITLGDEYRQVGERKWRFDAGWLRRQFSKSEVDLEGLRGNRDKDVCVIVGNGPSLSLIDRKWLEGQDLFISNFAFKDEFFLRNAKILSVVNYLVAEQGSYDLNLQEHVRKIFPSFLAYCLNEGERTTFVRSKGVLEFSKDPRRNVSWRSTVTFFHLQIAFWMGYKKAIMIGFDHSYKQDTKSKEGDILVCDGKDENHFRSDYFSGMRWQAADTENMEAVYRLAKQAYEEEGREIVNCTIGGKLELFRRGELAVELQNGYKRAGVNASVCSRQDPASKSFVEQKYCPRLLVVDLTNMGGFAATSRIKEAFFGSWPDEKLRIVCIVGGRLILSDKQGKTIAANDDRDEVMAAVSQYAPQVIYYRAVDDERVHSFACRLINEQPAPLVVHLMDDWPARLALTRPEVLNHYDRTLRSLLRVASARLSISSPMSRAFAERYDHSFDVLANGIDPEDFPPKQPKAESSNAFVIRYAGALARDMTFDSICNIAEAVEELSSELDIHLEIYTRSPWKEQALRRFSRMRSVSVLDQVPSEKYVALLQQADALLIAYNFDKLSQTYVRYSMANKLPEYLASGTPVIAHGPPNSATISYVRERACAHIIDQQDSDIVRAKIRELATSYELRKSLAKAGRYTAFKYHNLATIRNRLRQLLETVSKEDALRMLGPFSRDRAAHLDETDCIAQLIGTRPKGATMIDVGAHHGGALVPFLDKGWRVLAFEPDDANRRILLQRLAKHRSTQSASVDARAVSNESKQGLSFFRSEQSTGISGLSAFHPTHREAQRVDTVTLSEVLATRDVSAVDFLKIDTEGHDLLVLKGFPWDRFKPAVIECEFEDAKTVPLGYTFHDLASFLVEQGYKVFVSEWHPVLRYGIRHDWHRLLRYPCELADDKAWGNLLAFRDGIDEAKLVEALKKVLKFGTPAANTVISLAPQGTPIDTVLTKTEVANPTAVPSPAVGAPSSVNPAATATAGASSQPAPLPLPERVVVHMDAPPNGDNWHPPEHNVQWGFCCWSGPGERATLRIMARRDRETLAIVAYAGSLLEEQLIGLRIEVDSALVPHSIRPDLSPACIVARLPARSLLSDDATELALVLPRTISPSSLSADNPDGRPLGLSVISVSVIPAEPALPLQFPVSRLQGLKNRIGLAARSSSAGDFPLSHFDGMAYLEAYPDVADAVRGEPALSAIDHYIRHGYREGRRCTLAVQLSPNRGTFQELLQREFDGLAYLKTNPDVAEAVRRQEIQSALDHYIRHGCKEGRTASRADHGKARIGSLYELLEEEFQTQLAARTHAVKEELEKQLGVLQKSVSARSEDLVRLRQDAESLQVGLTQVRERISGAARREDLERIEKETMHHFEKIRAELASMSAIRDAREQALGARLEGLKSGIEHTHKELSAAARRERELGSKSQQISESLSVLGNRLESAIADAEKLQAEVAAVKSQSASDHIRLTDPKLNTFNILHYQGFPRALSTVNAERLSKHWAPLLRIEIQQKELYYLAHRICSIENLCQGRLAASIQDVLLRIIVARSTKPKALEVLEIGTLFGLGIIAMHEALAPLFEEVRFTAVDPLEGYYGAANRDILTGVPITPAVFEENLRRSGVSRDRVTLIRLLSTDPRALERTGNKRYDLLVIDADHTYVGVKNDADKFIGTVAPEGYVIFDDYGNPYWPDVQRYVDAEVMPRKDLEFLGAEWHTAVFRVTDAAGMR